MQQFQTLTEVSMTGIKEREFPLFEHQLELLQAVEKPSPLMIMEILLSILICQQQEIILQILEI